MSKHDPRQEESLFEPTGEPSPETWAGASTLGRGVAHPPQAQVPAIDRPVVSVGMSHPDTSHKAAAKALGRAGTARRRVFQAILEAGPRGMTTDEVEVALNRPHQTISATVNSLWNDLLLVRTDQTRRTRWGNDAYVYVVSDHGVAQWRASR